MIYVVDIMELDNDLVDIVETQNIYVLSYQTIKCLIFSIFSTRPISDTFIYKNRSEHGRTPNGKHTIHIETV